MATLGKIIEEGKIVLSHQWDSGGPGAGADAINIYRLGDQYATISDQEEHLGPYETLAGAITESDALSVTDASTSIESEEMSVEEILESLKCFCEDDPPSLTVNGSTCEYDAGADCYIMA